MILAGGSGSRAGAEIDGRPVNKVYLPLGDRPVLAWSVRAADQAHGVRRLVVVVRSGQQDLARRMLADHPPQTPVDVVVGGEARHDSERAGLTHLEPAITSGEIDVIAIHDGARPLATPDLFSEVLAVASQVGGAVPAVTTTLLSADDSPTPDFLSPGTSIVAVQTPQAFRARPLLTAYAAAARQGFEGTDTASFVERFTDVPIQVVPSTAANLKLTFRGDLVRAARLAAQRI